MSKKVKKHKQIELSAVWFWVISAILILLIIWLIYRSSHGLDLFKDQKPKVEINVPKEESKPEEKNIIDEKSPVKTEIIVSSDILIPYIKDSSTFIYNSDGRYYINYSKKDLQPYWVAYILTRNEVKKRSVERSSKFKEDIKIINAGFKSAKLSDYKGSGYDRGHLIPSADRNDSKKENEATFLLSNIAPQESKMNRGVWQKLESEVRMWAGKYDSLYVVTGGVLKVNKNEKPFKSIGNGITVPNVFYKVVVVKIKGKYYANAYLVPNNEYVSEDFKLFRTSVDNVENVTGLDFFHLLPDSIENEIEKYTRPTNDIWNIK